LMCATLAAALCAGRSDIEELIRSMHACEDALAPYKVAMTPVKVLRGVPVRQESSCRGGRRVCVTVGE
jgi:hypothetical protein